MELETTIIRNHRLTGTRQLFAKTAHAPPNWLGGSGRFIDLQSLLLANLVQDIAALRADDIMDESRDNCWLTVVKDNISNPRMNLVHSFLRYCELGGVYTGRIKTEGLLREYSVLVSPPRDFVLHSSLNGCNGEATNSDDVNINDENKRRRREADTQRHRQISSGRHTSVTHGPPALSTNQQNAVRRILRKGQELKNEMKGSLILESIDSGAPVDGELPPPPSDEVKIPMVLSSDVVFYTVPVSWTDVVFNFLKYDLPIWLCALVLFHELVYYAFEITIITISVIPSFINSFMFSIATIVATFYYMRWVSSEAFSHFDHANLNVEGDPEYVSLGVHPFMRVRKFSIYHISRNIYVGSIERQLWNFFVPIANSLFRTEFRMMERRNVFQFSGNTSLLVQDHDINIVAALGYNSIEQVYVFEELLFKVYVSYCSPNAHIHTITAIECDVLRHAESSGRVDLTDPLQLSACTNTARVIFNRVQIKQYKDRLTVGKGLRNVVPLK